MLAMVPAVALNVLLVAPAKTVTDVGTVSSALLLESVTTAPPVAAACESVTVQVDVPADPSVGGLHARELTVVGAVKEKVACCELLL